MDAQKERILQDLQQRIERTQRLMEMVDTLPDNLPGSVTALGGDVNIHIPFNPAIFADVRRAIGHGWKLVSKFGTDTSGSLYRQYRNALLPDFGLYIIMDTYREGSTCRRVQVGTKEIPVYQIVCE